MNTLIIKKKLYTESFFQWYLIDTHLLLWSNEICLNCKIVAIVHKFMDKTGLKCVKFKMCPNVCTEQQLFV